MRFIFVSLRFVVILPSSEVRRRNSSEKDCPISMVDLDSGFRVWVRLKLTIQLCEF